MTVNELSPAIEPEDYVSMCIRNSVRVWTCETLALRYTVEITNIANGPYRIICSFFAEEKVNWGRDGF